MLMMFMKALLGYPAEYMEQSVVPLLQVYSSSLASSPGTKLSMEMSINVQKTVNRSRQSIRLQVLRSVGTYSSSTMSY